MTKDELIKQMTFEEVIDWLFFKIAEDNWDISDPFDKNKYKEIITEKLGQFI